MEEIKKYLKDKNKKNFDSRNSEEATDFTVTQLKTDVCEFQEEAQKEEKKFMEDNRLYIEYIQNGKMNKKLEEMDKRLEDYHLKEMKDIKEVKDAHSKEIKEIIDAHSKEMK